MMDAKPGDLCTCCGNATTLEEAALLCPGCAATLRKKCQDEHQPAAHGPEREHDHRGVLLPRRTRVGGIITPQ
ncbi:MAG: hypothetical protein ACP5EP_04155 [Acidobacteriaceae bacterium]